MSERDDAWVADTSIGWRIMLAAELHAPPDPDELVRQWRQIAADQGWPTPPPLCREDDLAFLHRVLAEHHPAPVRLGVCDSHLVISAHHSRLDGLAMLRMLDLLGHGPTRSDARGVGGRPAPSGALSSIGRRLREAALTPPARIEPPRSAPADGDRMVWRTVPGTHRTAALVRASAEAATAWGSSRGQEVRHVAVAIGASSDPHPTDPVLRDRSALLRLVDVEGLDDAGLSHALRTAPVQTPPVPGRHRPWTPAVAWAAGAAMRALGPRLGSTMLVSHLGSVTAPAAKGLRLFPVTAGGTGLSLGAVEHDGRTSLTLRGRAVAWDDDGLVDLLDTVISKL